MRGWDYASSNTASAWQSKGITTYKELAEVLTRSNVETSSGKTSWDARFGTLVAGDILGEKLKVTADHLEQVVEVVRHATRTALSRERLTVWAETR